VTWRALLTHSALAASCILLWVFTNPPVTIVAVGAGAIAASLLLTRRAENERVRAAAAAGGRAASEAATYIATIEQDVRRHEQMLDAMDIAVVLVEDDRVVYANPAARAILGAQADRPVPAALTGLGEGKRSTQDIVIHHPDYREIRCTAVALPGTRSLILAQDVTEARRIDAIRRDFVANASHELKTPVAGILATAETLQDAIAEDPQQARRFAETLAKEAARLSNLVQDLLDLARLEQPEAEQVSRLDLAAVVRRGVDEVRSTSVDRGLTIESVIAEVVPVRGTERDIAQLTRNLLDNAVRYTPAGGRIDVALTVEDGKAVLRVSDTGVGIPQRDLPRIFERFYRVDRARARETGGTGLGLSIVRHIAESLGGSVMATSELGKGSTFTVRLPLAG
jgi:signal transduction histidine kinase